LIKKYDACGLFRAVHALNPGIIIKIADFQMFVNEDKKIVAFSRGM